MFFGSSALLANLVAILGPVLIVIAEGPRFLSWLERRRLDPILHPAIAAASAVEAQCHVPTRITTAGLLDPNPTERIAARDFTAQAQSAPAVSESAVLVGTRGAAPEPRVVPSIRNPRP